MARVIDGDAVKRRIWDIAEAWKDQGRNYEALLLESVIEQIVDTQPTLTPPNEWVSVEERLPENHAQVLMWSARWNIAEAGSYYNRRFWVYSEIGDGYIADDITHWMPIPAPPDRRPPEGEEDT